MVTNTTQQLEVESVEYEEEKIPKLIDHDTSVNGEISTEHYIQYHDDLETILEENEEEPPTTVQDDVDEADTIPYAPEESDDEQFNTAINDTSKDLTIVMGKQITTTFVSVDVHVPTEKVGCSHVTSQLRVP